MESQQLKAIAHLECVARNVIRGSDKVSTLQGAVRRCRNAGVRSRMIGKAIRGSDADFKVKMFKVENIITVCR